MGLRRYIESEGLTIVHLESSEVADISSTDDGEVDIDATMKKSLSIY